MNSSLNGAGGVTAINSIDDALSFFESEHNYDPAAVMKTHSNIGTVWGLDENKVFSWTGTNPGAWAEYIVVEDNSTTPSTIKLDAVIGSDYQGAPLVENVHAEQIPGTKSVMIDFSRCCLPAMRLGGLAFLRQTFQYRILVQIRSHFPSMGRVSYIYRK